MKKKIAAMILLLLFSMLLTLNIRVAEASDTIYIRADGSIDPPTANIVSTDNVTYAFTDDIYDEIVVQRNNTVIDGEGYTLEGSGGGNGFNLTSIDNVTIRNINIDYFFRCILLHLSSNNTISGNNISRGNSWGILLWESNNNTISGNNVFNNDIGINIRYSSYNVVSRNTVTNNPIGISAGDAWNNYIIGNNITDSRGAASAEPLILDYGCEYNVASENNVTNNDWHGIWIRGSYNVVSRNIVTDNVGGGIDLGPARFNTLVENVIVSNGAGINIRYDSYNNTVWGNNLTRNRGDVVYMSNVAYNNKFFHNNFVNNSRKVYVEAGLVNIWDDGYPSGGNYWSDYTGNDTFNGPNQDQLGSDGVGDTPYVINVNNSDNFPLMMLWGSPISYKSNTTIMNAVFTKTALHFETSGPEGTTGHVNVTLPVYFNKTAIKVFVDDIEITSIVTSNGTHYFIHFEFIQSNHNITVQYAITDVAITSAVSPKTVVGQNFTAIVMITVENQGNFSETFNLTAYYDGTAISTEQWPDGAYSQTFWSMGDAVRDGYIDLWDLDLIASEYGWIGPVGKNPADINSDGMVNTGDVITATGNFGLDIWTFFGIPKLVTDRKNVTLLSGHVAVVAFRWNTTYVNKGNYVLSADASYVPGETDLADNGLVNGAITVAMIGDINGQTKNVPDGKADMRDVALIATAFGLDVGADITNPGPGMWTWLEYWHLEPEPNCPHHPNCDLTGPVEGVPDGKIDMRDIGLAASRFGDVDP